MFRSSMFLVSAAVLAPLGRPLRIHQPELVAGQKLVREVVCRIAGEKGISVREVSVERLCHAGSNYRLFGRVESRQDAQQIIEEFTADEVVVNEAVVLLAGIGSIGPETRIQSLQTCLLPCLGIAPDVEVAVNDSTGSEVRIDLKKKVLRMGFEKDAPFTDNLRPAVENGDHYLADHERLRLGAQPLDHLDEQRAILGMLEIPSVQGEVGNQESRLLEGTGSSLPYQKTPGGATVAVDEAKAIRQVGEFVEPDVCEVVSGFNTVADVLPPEPPIEARDAAGVLEFDEVACDIRRRFLREHCPGRGGWSDLERLAAPEDVEFVQVVNSRTRPSLRVNQEAHLLRRYVELY